MENLDGNEISSDGDEELNITLESEISSDWNLIEYLAKIFCFYTEQLDRETDDAFNQRMKKKAVEFVNNKPNPYLRQLQKYSVTYNAANPFTITYPGVLKELYANFETLAIIKELMMCEYTPRDFTLLLWLKTPENGKVTCDRLNMQSTLGSRDDWKGIYFYPSTSNTTSFLDVKPRRNGGVQKKLWATLFHGKREPVLTQMNRTADPSPGSIFYGGLTAYRFDDYTQPLTNNPFIRASAKEKYKINKTVISANTSKELMRRCDHQGNSLPVELILHAIMGRCENNPPLWMLLAGSECFKQKECSKPYWPEKVCDLNDFQKFCISAAIVERKLYYWEKNAYTTQWGPHPHQSCIGDRASVEPSRRQPGIYTPQGFILGPKENVFPVAAPTEDVQAAFSPKVTQTQETAQTQVTIASTKNSYGWVRLVSPKLGAAAGAAVVTATAGSSNQAPNGPFGSLSWAQRSQNDSVPVGAVFKAVLFLSAVILGALTLKTIFNKVQTLLFRKADSNDMFKKGDVDVEIVEITDIK